MIMKKILKRRKATKQDKEQEERLVAIRQGLFGDRPAAEPSATDRMEVGERERVKVKREREEEKAKDVLKKAKAWSGELRAVTPSLTWITLRSQRKRSMRRMSTRTRRRLSDAK